MILGAAQLTSNGTTTFKTALPAGTWNLYAFFVGTNDVLSSGSGLHAITVTGTLSSYTTVNFTGEPGNYTLNAYVEGSWPAPSGNVSFVDSSNKDLVFAMGAVFASSSMFGLVQPTVTGEETDWIAVGDFNGDGKPDLAVVNVNSTLSIFLNKGDGTFSAPASVTVGTGNQTAALVVGDFNEDGKADLAVTLFEESEAFILVGNGNGTFTMQATPLKTGTGPFWIPAGDFNVDGLPDLAIANDDSNNLSVFVNSLKTSATATLTDVTIAGSGNQSVEANYPGATNFSASTSNALSLPAN